MPRGERPSVIRRPKWSPEEDAQLVRLVEEHGVGNWAAIARDLKSTNNRDKKAVRSRWVYQLDPNVNKGPFTTDEENIIFEQYEKVGAHWAEIAKALPGRTDGAIKNYWNGHLVKKLPYRKLAIKGKRTKRKTGKKSSAAATAAESAVKTARPIHDAFEKLETRAGYPPNCPTDWGLKYEGTVYPDFDFSLTSEASNKRPKPENEAQSGPESFMKSETEWTPLWYPTGALQSTGGVTAATPPVPPTHWTGYSWTNDYPQNNPLYPWGGVQNWMKDYANICNNNGRRNEQRNSCQTAESLLERGPSTEMD